MEHIISKLYYMIFALISTWLIYEISKSYHRKRNYVKSNRNTITLDCTELYSLLLIIIVVLFCAFREIDYGVGGTDAYAYMMQFSQSIGTFSEQLIRFRGWEPLHAASLWIVRLFTDEYRVYLVIYYVVMSFFLIKYAKMVCLNKRWLLATFALMLFFLNSFNTQRNIFAVFASFFILDKLLKKEHKKALVLILIIMGFHFSAAIWFVVFGATMVIRYFKGNIKIKLVGYVLVSSLLSIMALRMFPVIVDNTRLSVYLNSESSFSIPMFLAWFMVMVFFLIYYREMKNYSEDVILLSIIYISFLPMFIFQLQYAIMYRMMLYTLPVLYIVLSEYLDFFSKKYGNYNLLNFVVNIMILIRILPFIMAEEVGDIGTYSNVLF